MGWEELSVAMTNRSLKTIKAELDFLSDSSLITPQQYETIIAQLPHQPAVPASQAVASPAPPSASMNSLSLNNSNTNGSVNEKQNGYFNEKQGQTNGYQSPPGPPPPAYNSPAPSALCSASALYAYQPTDAGDLALSPNDRIIVTEYMNAEWWKGQNERTNLEGIFPRSYVKVLDEKPPALAGTPQPLPQQQQNSGPMSYGNMPMAVAQGDGGNAGQNQPPSKTQEQGKKFGKKLGNAAIFGAGASIGGNIVNSIF
ncbi:SH3-domain-containing protein [Viridothelium virens]|uniref:SH3-domain-containing protein n=1 Tax=Viridothelium virens TaxID=1048519 RepID=A0A6A6HJX2_VIRVR|nr:SH3-domain-containing protein [Viridothelium virens]